MKKIWLHDKTLSFMAWNSQHNYNELHIADCNKRIALYFDYDQHSISGCKSKVEAVEKLQKIINFLNDCKEDILSQSPQDQ